MQSWGLGVTGPSCMEQLTAEGEGGGQELAKGDPEVWRLMRLLRLSKRPRGSVVKAVLSLRSSSVRLVRLSNTPGGRLIKSLFHRVTYVRLVSLLNTAGSRLVNAL